jgi:beta-barrel assembly-enhancing protease
MKHTPAARSAVLIAIGALAVSSASCAWIDKATDKAERLAADALLPIPEEIKLGKELSAEVEKESKLHESDEVQEYIRALGKKIAEEAKDRPLNIRFTFKVIDDDKTVNAFALPGGHIYVYTGLMKLADDESELAGVIGHEIAHVTQRHIAERLVAAYGIEALSAIALGQNPGMAGQIAKQVLGGGSLLAYGRDQESEADMKGLPYSLRAGYDPGGFVRLFKKLAKGEGPGFTVILQSHPMPSQRVEDVEAWIKKLKDPPTGRNKDEYQALLGKL